MLTILVKTIVNTNNNTLVKSIANTNTFTAFKNYCQYQYFLLFLHSATCIFLQSSINKVNKMTVVEKMAKALQFTVT